MYHMSPLALVITGLLGGTSLASSPAANPRDGAELVAIPAGEFLMGSAAEVKHAWCNETPQRRVWLDAYRIYRQPVTLNRLD